MADPFRDPEYGSVNYKNDRVDAFHDGLSPSRSPLPLPVYSGNFEAGDTAGDTERNSITSDDYVVWQVPGTTDHTSICTICIRSFMVGGVSLGLLAGGVGLDMALLIGGSIGGLWAVWELFSGARKSAGRRIFSIALYLASAILLLEVVVILLRTFKVI